MTGLPDIVLLRQIIEGKREVFPSLVDRYGPVIHALAQQILEDPDEARDVTLQTFREGYRNLRRLPDLNRFFPQLLEEARSQAHARLATRTDPDQTHAKPDRSWPFQGTKILLRKKYLEGKSYEEISVHLGMKPHQVEARIRHARHQLRWSRLAAGVES